MSQNKTTPLVSILMPAFNAEQHIRSTIDSILAQTYINWELYVVNDHSTDDTSAIIQALAKKDPRIKVLQNLKKGIIPALQLAFEQSTGKLITRMDADDLMTASKIEKLVRSSLNHQDCCITNYVEYFSDGQLHEGFAKYANWLNQMIDNKSHWDAIYKECVIPSPSWMMHRRTLQSVGAFDSEKYPEDYDLCFRLYEAKIPVIGIPEILHLWRDHPNRASRNDPNYADQHFLDLKLDYFFSLDYDDSKALCVWGAGPTGKALAKNLISRNICFHWCTGNHSKIGKHIYNVLIESEEMLVNKESKQIILAIKEPEFTKNNALVDSIMSSKNKLFRFF